MAKPHIVQINANLSWTATKNAKSGAWVAACQALGITAQGKTWEELNSVIVETLDLLFGDLLHEGELDRFLAARHWSATGKVPKRAKHVRFDVPSTVFPAGANA